MRKRITIRVEMVNNKGLGGSTRGALAAIPRERRASILLPFVGIWCRRTTSPKMRSFTAMHSANLLAAALPTTRLVVGTLDRFKGNAANHTALDQPSACPSRFEIASGRTESVNSASAWPSAESSPATFALEAAARLTPLGLAVHRRESGAAFATGFIFEDHAWSISGFCTKSNNTEYAEMARRRIENPEPEPEIPDVEGQTTMEFSR